MPQVQMLLAGYIVEGDPANVETLAELYVKRFLKREEAPLVSHYLQKFLIQLRETFVQDNRYAHLILARDSAAALSALEHINNSIQTLTKEVRSGFEQLNSKLPQELFDFNEQWFNNQVEASIADAEASRRYLPALNIELPIGKLFDALGRTNEFFNRVFDLHRDFRKRHNGLFRWSIPDDELTVPLESVREQSESLMRVLSTIVVQSSGLLPFNEIQEACRKVIDAIVQAERSVSLLIKKLEDNQPETSTHEYNKPSKRAKHQRYELQELQYTTRILWEFAGSKEAILANKPFLLLTGEGGIGKTHLFCDVANQRIRQGLPTILLLGEKFQNDEPWHQIVRQLMLNESQTVTDHLQALNDFAANQNTRLVILIDALNEGSGTEIWPHYLGGFLHTASQYSHIALALSVRSEYEAYIIPDGLIDTGKLVKEYHSGFLGLVDRAVRTYFAYYGIEYRVPPLEREFQNPLFLQTLCRALQNRNLTYVPAGLQGFTQIMEFFLDSANERLAKRLGYNPRRNVVQLAILSLVEEMASTGSIYVSETKAEDIINRYLPNRLYQYTESLYYHLLAEGILTATIHENESSVRFLYDRFTDHLMAKHLLSKHLDPDKPGSAFELEQPLGQILTHKGNFGFRYSLIPAFAIQIPEDTGLELFQVAPYMKEDPDLARGVISSLVWRQWKTKEIPEPLIAFINESILADSHNDDRFLEAILGVAANPDNPFNADFLHRNLINRSMADRDAWWSIFLHYHYSRTDDEQTAINRLISWAWSDFDKSSIDPEAIRLMGIALAWFLTSSNRFLRDRTTKALVCLFEGHIHILVEVINQFIGVNDPYILERLFAVAYGCAMRSNNSQQIKFLAEQVFIWNFRDGSPPPHILLRDYARGVIEVALVKCSDMNIPVEKVRPPYLSEWISEPPSDDELKSQYGTHPDNILDAERSMHTIYFSVMGWDFGRYIIPKVENWTAVRLHDELELSPHERYDQFFERLEPQKHEFWNSFQDTKTALPQDLDPIVKRVMDDWDKEIEFDDDLFVARISEKLVKSGYDETSADETLNAELKKFLESLTQEQIADYEGIVVPYEQNRVVLENAYREKSHFNLELAKRWILKRVFEIGWTIERFGEFDYYVNYRSYGREAKKAERIGKKYQWIAFHELLARIADNFHYRGESWNNSQQQYEGTWQAWVRDIDPSFIKAKTHYSSETQAWWFSVKYEQWDGYETDAQWVESTRDLPQIAPLIEVINPEDGSRWLNLDAMFDWEEPIPPIEDKYERPRRRLWYMLKSYLVRREDSDRFFDWAQQQDFIGRWMPESHDLYEVFLGEFFWSPAYRYHRSPATGYREWETLGDMNSSLPCPVCVTIDEYAHEDSYDCSIEDSASLNTPSKWLAEKMKLRWQGQEGRYHDQQGNLICFDPTAQTKGPGSLLMNREHFLQFLNDSDLDIVWTLLGEKNIIGHDTATEWLKISGAYRLSNGQPVGSWTTKFETR